MRIFLLICLLLLTACDATNPPAADTQRTGWHPILTENRRFVYAARWYAPGTTTATLDTVVLTALGKPWASDSTQTAYEWSFRFELDTTLTTAQSVVVGAFDKPNKFWLHPPRRSHYNITELNPFPDIELPAKIGRTWKVKNFYAPDYASNPAWATWEGSLYLQQQWKITDSTLLPTPLGSLPCHRVQAISTCKLGTTALESYFNPLYGFVRMHYRNIDQSRLELELVSVTSRPTLDKSMFSRHL
ncbi:hypothetical protein H8B15_05295 [Hymenobacter sp. BT507]|uniref:Lipoprotein n=1 Tax=Hymenobacter citatus TaxID=2763506 RepID=A0ABR7MH94_9BACT|nr:hypothetical protein [Hymenobacter citatus]MBC6610323.1 hypothetical protein [Hymenobacter citatus]